MLNSRVCLILLTFELPPRSNPGQGQVEGHELFEEMQYVQQNVHLLSTMFAGMKRKRYVAEFTSMKCKRHIAEPAAKRSVTRGRSSRVESEVHAPVTFPEYLALL